MSKKLSDLKWQSVPLDGFPQTLTDEFQSFGGLEECTSYGLDKEKTRIKKKKTQKKKRKKTSAGEKEIPNKKTKLSNGFLVENCNTVTPSLSNQNGNKKNKDKIKNNKEKVNPQTGDGKRDSVTSTEPERDEITDEDMLPWAEFRLPDELLRALRDLRFTRPTRIQQLALPAALHGRRDILGAAETGSGKTLAFGLPILAGLLRLHREARATGRPVHEIPYKNSSAERRAERREPKRNERRKRPEAKESSEDGYGSDRGSDPEPVREIVVPVRRPTSADSDEGHDSEDDDEDYLHLSDVLHDDDDDDDDENTDSQDELDADREGNDASPDGESKDAEGAAARSGASSSSAGAGAGAGAERSGPLALVVTPTRELALQVSRHLRALARHTGLRVCCVVGGLAAVKQERQLARAPELVVGTPGRLWELRRQGEPHLQRLHHLKFLALDETDRLLERGHFAELTPLLELLNAAPPAASPSASSAASPAASPAASLAARRRQNFVFSATLTLTHAHAPARRPGRRRTAHTAQDKLRRLIDLVGITDPKVVDITAENHGAAATLTECRVVCAHEHKDAYLYHVLTRYPARTIVFCNAIGAVKRLANLLTLVKLRPLPLHAGMPQRQRLRNLERFSAEPAGVLLATDVAARGLDIPAVRHVLHYQVPRTAENYVHRSGRTARAHAEGLTLLLMEPAEAQRYARLCVTLDKKGELPTFPVAASALDAARGVMRAAVQLDALLLRARRLRGAAAWRRRAAADCDLLLDDDAAPAESSDAALDRAVRLQRKQLDALLAPVPGVPGVPAVPGVPGVPVETEDALQVMKRALASGSLRRDRRRSKNAPLLALHSALRTPRSDQRPNK